MIDLLFLQAFVCLLLKLTLPITTLQRLQQCSDHLHFSRDLAVSMMEEQGVLEIKVLLPNLECGGNTIYFWL